MPSVVAARAALFRRTGLPPPRSPHSTNAEHIIVPGLATFRVVQHSGCPDRTRATVLPNLAAIPVQDSFVDRQPQNPLWLAPRAGLRFICRDRQNAFAFRPNSSPLPAAIRALHCWSVGSTGTAVSCAIPVSRPAYASDCDKLAALKFVSSAETKVVIPIAVPLTSACRISEAVPGFAWVSSAREAFPPPALRRNIQLAPFVSFPHMNAETFIAGPLQVFRAAQKLALLNAQCLKFSLRRISASCAGFRLRSL